jgi:isopentenyl-diphosphate delta-isomerase
MSAIAPPAVQQVILVDRDDNALGIGDKISTHREGRLHRAFSIFVFDSDCSLLVQERARDKYHSGNLWSNTCCGHPKPMEDTLEAANRRLREEMGFDCVLEKAFSFVYKVRLADGNFEHEYDHVFTGRFDGEPCPDPREVGDWKWISTGDLRRDISLRPKKYTAWLALSIDRVLDLYLNNRTGP